MESGQPSTKHRAGPLNHVLTKHILRTHKPQRVGSRIKLHKNINNLIKKDHVCYSAAPSTTNQNATQGTYIKDIKWLGKSLWAYSIKIQYENVFKSDRWCSCYTCLPQSSPTAQRKVDAPGTGAPPVAQRLLTNTWPKTMQQHKHTCKQ